MAKAPGRWFLSTVFGSMVLLSAAVPAAAQTGELHGRVIDPQGGAVGGATVEVVLEAGALRRRTETDRQGRFRLLELPSGVYSVTVGAPGFARRMIEGLHLAVGQSQPLEVRLELEAVEESIEAIDTAIPVGPGSSTVDLVIGAEEIEQLPLNGRNFLELALLAPGNSPAPGFDPTKSTSVIVSSAGQAGRGGMVTVDGADNNDDMVGGPLLNVPQDAVAEFQIATNQYGAERGRSASSAINVVTRSGSDDLQGSLSLFHRDDSLQALPDTIEPGQPEPSFDRQHYAVAAGGPIRPGRAHWFAAAEVRDQDGGIQVGERDPAVRTITRKLTEAPLTDELGFLRSDWAVSAQDLVTLRYAYQAIDDTAASSLERSLGSATQLQTSSSDHHNLLGRWTGTLSPNLLGCVEAGWSRFRNSIDPIAPGVQLTFPSLQDGSSFRVPQSTDLDRLQLGGSLSWLRGRHGLEAGAEVQRIDAALGLGVFRDGRIELVEDFAPFDRNGDGSVDDDDLLFGVTLRSAFPDRDLTIDDVDNTYTAVYLQDDWQASPNLTFNLGLRWEMDSDVKNVSRYDEINPLVRPFLEGDRKRDDDNFGPRLGFSWAPGNRRFVVRGGYGIFYDRVTLQLQTLERGLDGRALPIEVRAGNVFFLDPATGTLPPFAPTLSNPFTGFILPGAGASGINIIDNDLENPEVEQTTLGFEARLPARMTLRVDGVYDRGTNFIIGRTVGEVFNPVVGGPDRVVNLESSVGTRYRGLLVALERRAGRHRFLASYTLSKSENYANDDQIPFSSGPIDPDDLEREFGPAANDRRHRFTFSGTFELPGKVTVSPLLTVASGVPMDILMPDGSSRVPVLPRNAGGTKFDNASELNDFLRKLNAQGGIDGVLLPLVDEDARFNDTFSSLDLRVARAFRLRDRASLLAMVEVFNLFDTTNVLGVSNLNYSGYSNVLVRDSEDPDDPGYLRSSSFGKPVTTAGGVFGSGGPRAVQLGLRLEF